MEKENQMISGKLKKYKNYCLKNLQQNNKEQFIQKTPGGNTSDISLRKDSL